MASTVGLACIRWEPARMRSILGADILSKAKVAAVTRRQSSHIAYHARPELSPASRGHLSQWCCILRNEKPIPRRRDVPTVRPVRAGAIFSRDYKLPAGDRAMPMRDSFFIPTSPDLILKLTPLYGSALLSLYVRTKFDCR
jgi:hypothetical protein